MRRGLIFTLVSACLLTPAMASAQESAETANRRYVPAPWWMRDPVVAALGRVHINRVANRASFTATFSEVGDTAEQALANAARRSGPLDARLQAFGEEKLRFTRTFTTRPLYRQYRDADGNRVDNQRADQIERYEVSSTIRIDIRDVAAVEAVYAAVTAASPSSVSTVNWTLVADDATITELATAATRDATRRAREGAEAAGAHLGPVRIIDPSGSVCATQVLTGWPGYMARDESRDVGNDVDNGASRLSARRGAVSAPPPSPPPPPPPPPGTEQVTLRPPMMRLEDSSCVIFSILP